jgi:NAD(P)-dependent dehydrogenase (short-subunit alcohol dehydrogenase family)
MLAKEVGPLGVGVTIIEPGGFRTDFAGSSTELREGRPEYDETVGTLLLSVGGVMPTSIAPGCS